MFWAYPSLAFERKLIFRKINIWGTIHISQPAGGDCD